MILMKNKINYEIIAPNGNNSEIVFAKKILKPFDDIAIDFIAELSNRILKDAKLKEFPELISMAFWMRKSHILSLKQEFLEKRKDRIWLARGTAFHIAPSNVDTIFIYSWFLSMLVGNKNIIRISQNQNNQLNLLIEKISELCERKKFLSIKERFMLITYQHNDDITEFFSKKCDLRVIWGGDNTINKIRSININPTAIELSFADKFSIAVIDANKIVRNSNETEKLFENFYNDAFWFDQQACSSPKLVCWIGDRKGVSRAKEIFWNGVNGVYQDRFSEFNATRSVDKIVATYSLAIEGGEISINKDSLIQRVQLKDYKSISRDLHCGAGLFYEISLDSIDQLNKLIIKKDQTIGTFGFDKKIIKDFVENNLPEGIDRIVSIGKMLDFSNVWDGHDLLREFCREINIDL